MCRFSLRAGLLLLAALAPGAPALPLSAQTPSEPPGQEIVVEGRQRQALRDFVEAVANPSRSGQLARWVEEMCPTVIGIDPAQAEYMEDRIAEVAASVRLQRPSRGCLTTSLILVTTEPSALAASLARDYPITLSTDGRALLQRFVRTTRPIRWLSVTDSCGPEGCALPNSRLTRATRPRFAAMVVIVDATQIGSFTLGEISDYVALVALGNPRPARRGSSNSILSMFEIEREPGSSFALTAYDRAFLDGLYRSRIDGSGQEQRASIVDRMRDEDSR